MSSIAGFDETRFYLGSLCKRGHEWSNTGKSLRRKSKRECMACHHERAQAAKKAIAAGRQKKSPLIDSDKTIMSEMPEYKSWYLAKRRCVNPADAAWKDYGARGIKMCDRWLNNFHNFLDDMGLCPVGVDGKRYTIERLNVNKGYEPGNCTWIPLKDQGRNTRTTIHVEYEGETIHLSGLARKLNVGVQQLFYRYRTLGLPLEEAVVGCRQLPKD